MDDLRSTLDPVIFLEKVRRPVLRGLVRERLDRHLASLSTFFRFLIFDGRLEENVAGCEVVTRLSDGSAATSASSAPASPS